MLAVDEVIMRRREFVALIGAATAAWYRDAEAQQARKYYRVGILTGQLRSEDEDTAAFVDEMHRNGFEEGRNLGVDHRGIYNPADLKAAAAELVASGPDVLVAFGPRATFALKETGTTLPIIFGQVADPVAIGVVKSLARPGGNVTGVSNFTTDIAAKKVQLLHEALPRATKIGAVTQPGNPIHQMLVEQYSAAAAELGLSLVSFPVHEPSDVAGMLEAALAASVNALISSPLFVMWIRRREIIEFAAKHRLPTVYSWMQEARQGGLMSFGPDPLHLARRLAGYVMKVVAGAAPATLPVEQPTNLLLILNLKTARAIDMEFPPLSWPVPTR